MWAGIAAAADRDLSVAAAEEPRVRLALSAIRDGHLEPDEAPGKWHPGERFDRDRWESERPELESAGTDGWLWSPWGWERVRAFADVMQEGLAQAEREIGELRARAERAEARLAEAKRRLGES